MSMEGKNLFSPNGFHNEPKCVETLLLQVVDTISALDEIALEFNPPEAFSKPNVESPVPHSPTMETKRHISNGVKLKQQLEETVMSKNIVCTHDPNESLSKCQFSYSASSFITTNYDKNNFFQSNINVSNMEVHQPKAKDSPSVELVQNAKHAPYKFSKITRDMRQMNTGGYPKLKFLLTNNIDKNVPYTLKCKVCNYSTIDLPNFKLHERSHIQLLACQVCQFWSNDPKVMSFHRRMHESDISQQCDQCVYSTKDKLNMEVHKSSHCKILRCEDCLFWSLDQEVIEQHRKGHSKKTSESPSKTNNLRQYNALSPGCSTHNDNRESNFLSSGTYKPIILTNYISNLNDLPIMEDRQIGFRSTATCTEIPNAVQVVELPKNAPPVSPTVPNYFISPKKRFVHVCDECTFSSPWQSRLKAHKKIHGSLQIYRKFSSSYRILIQLRKSKLIGVLGHYFGEVIPTSSSLLDIHRQRLLSISSLFKRCYRPYVQPTNALVRFCNSKESLLPKHFRVPESLLGTLLRNSKTSVSVPEPKLMPHLAQITTSTSEFFSCQMCPFASKSVFALRQHIQSCHEKEDANKMDVSSSCKQSGCHCGETHCDNEIFVCHSCNFANTCKERFEEHRRACGKTSENGFNNDVRSTLPISCTINEIASDMENATSTNEIKLKNGLIENEDGVKTSPDTKPCVVRLVPLPNIVCASLSAPSDTVKATKKAKEKLVLYGCEQCDSAFRSQQGLRSHKSQRHKQDLIMIHKCDKCPFTSLSARGIKLHNATHNSRRSQFSCSKALRSFNSESESVHTKPLSSSSNQNPPILTDSTIPRKDQESRPVNPPSLQKETHPQANQSNSTNTCKYVENVPVSEKSCDSPSEDGTLQVKQHSNSNAHEESASQDSLLNSTDMDVVVTSVPKKSGDSPKKEKTLMVNDESKSNVQEETSSKVFKSDSKKNNDVEMMPVPKTSDASLPKQNCASVILPSGSNVTREVTLAGCSTMNVTNNATTSVSSVKESNVTQSVYKCDECGFTARTMHGLRLHKVAHTRKTLYPCNKCFNRYKTENYLRHHQSRCHSNQNSTSTGSSLVVNNNPTSQAPVLKEPTPITPATVPKQPTPITPSTVPKEPTPITTSTVPKEPTPITPSTVPKEPTPITPSTVPKEPTPITPSTVPKEPTPITTTTVPKEPTPITTTTVPKEPMPITTTTIPKVIQPTEQTSNPDRGTNEVVNIEDAEDFDLSQDIPSSVTFSTMPLKIKQEFKKNQNHPCLKETGTVSAISTDLETTNCGESLGFNGSALQEESNVEMSLQNINPGDSPRERYSSARTKLKCEHCNYVTRRRDILNSHKKKFHSLQKHPKYGHLYNKKRFAPATPTCMKSDEKTLLQTKPCTVIIKSLSDEEISSIMNIEMTVDVDVEDDLGETLDVHAIIETDENKIDVEEERDKRNAKEQDEEEIDVEMNKYEPCSNDVDDKPLEFAIKFGADGKLFMFSGNTWKLITVSK